MATTAQPVPPTPPENAGSSLRDKLQVVPPAETVEFINLLVYGEAGAGKTWLAGTAADDPRTSPVLFADVEGGLTTIRHRKDVDTKPIRSMAELEKLYNDLYKSITDGKLYYGTVVIDSLTELADLDMRIIMKQAYNNNPETTDVDVPSPREWGKTRNHMRTIVRAFRDLPCHVIYTCGLGITQEKDQPAKYHPGFGGKLKMEVPGFMDIVGFLKSEVDSITLEKSRNMQLLGTGRVTAKDRTSALGDQLINPTIPMMWDLINGS